MNSKERVNNILNHRDADKVVVDFGGTSVTGIHVEMIAKLRDYLGLKKQIVKVVEPFQMLGEIDEELLDILGVDILGLSGPKDMFGMKQENWKEFETFWGQTVLMPAAFGPYYNEEGELIVYPEGDTTVGPSARMPKSGYFYDAINRNGFVDDATLKVEDNLEEFGPISQDDLNYWKQLVESKMGSGKALVGNFGGTALGDIALVPALQLKDPKGVRNIEDWYVSTMIRPQFMEELYDRQTDIALENLKKIFALVGNNIDVMFLCGTDFGTQNSTFCSVDTFRELWLPYYKKVADWVHANTTWKLFKHSCGAVETLIESFIDSGIDILNPVQISAAGMDPKSLKDKYGDRMVFWGGGVDTQQVLSFGTPDDVAKQVLENLKIFSKGGGYVFNTVHNTQANTPLDNFLSMINTVKVFNGEQTL